MKREYWIFMLSFLSGVLLANMFRMQAAAESSLLNRYSLRTVSLSGIDENGYFVTILLMRLRTVIVLWMLSRILSRKIVVRMLTVLIFMIIGVIVTILVIENGVWGILFLLSSMFPHGLIYGIALYLWNGVESQPLSIRRSNHYIQLGVIWLLCLFGVFGEAFISPLCVMFAIKI